VVADGHADYRQVVPLEDLLPAVVLGVVRLQSVPLTVRLDDETGSTVEKIGNSQQRAAKVEERDIHQEVLQTRITLSEPAGQGLPRARRESRHLGQRSGELHDASSLVVPAAERRKRRDAACRAENASVSELGASLSRGS